MSESIEYPLSPHPMLSSIYLDLANHDKVEGNVVDSLALSVKLILSYLYDELYGEYMYSIPYTLVLISL